MNRPVLRRVTQGEYTARQGRQTPLSGRQGASEPDAAKTAELRPVDAMAAAREVAENTA